MVSNRFWMVCLSALLITRLLASTARTEQQDAQEKGFTKLFDGKTLKGWVQHNGKAKYTVEDECIVGRSTPGDKENSFLCTEKDFANFILEIDFKVQPRMNSGVQIRSESKKEYKNFRVHGYQVEIDPSTRAYTGGIYDEARRGWLFKLDKNEEARKAFKQDEWNHFRIEAKGDSIKTWINGVQAANLKDNMTPKGFIGLQVHANKSPTPLEVRWRNIRIKELP